MKNRIEDLRNHLFETLEALKDEEHPMDVERARAIADVGRVLVDSAKVEVQFLEATGQLGKGTGFIPLNEGDAERPTKPALIAGGGRR